MKFLNHMLLVMRKPLLGHLSEQNQALLDLEKWLKQTKSDPWRRNAKEPKT